MQGLGEGSSYLGKVSAVTQYRKQDGVALGGLGPKRVDQRL